jgi:hypothetical protein
MEAVVITGLLREQERRRAPLPRSVAALEERGEGRRERGLDPEHPVPAVRDRGERRIQRLAREVFGEPS